MNLDKLPPSGAMLYVIPMLIKNGTVHQPASSQSFLKFDEFFQNLKLDIFVIGCITKIVFLQNSIL